MLSGRTAPLPPAMASSGGEEALQPFYFLRSLAVVVLFKAVVASLDGRVTGEGGVSLPESSSCRAAFRSLVKKS